MKARGPLALGFVVAGAALPLLPRWIVPLLRPNVRYLENAASLLADRRAFALFSALSALPFIVLATFAWFHLRTGDRKRSIAVLAAFTAMFIRRDRRGCYGQGHARTKVRLDRAAFMEDSGRWPLSVAVIL